MSTCNPFFFTIAWFGTLLVYYGHVLLLLLTLIFGSPVLIRCHVGQFVNLMVGFIFYWSLGSYFQFECQFEEATVTNNFFMIHHLTSYKNAIPFPAIDIQLLYFSFVYLIMAYYRSEWKLNTDNKHIYYRFLFLMSLIMFITTLLYLWFYSFAQILISILLGSTIAFLWYRAIQRFIRYTPILIHEEYYVMTTPPSLARSESLTVSTDTIIETTNESKNQ